MTLTESQQFNLPSTDMCAPCERGNHTECYHDAAYGRCACAVRGHRCECKHYRDLHHKGVKYGLDVFYCEVCGCPEFSEESRGGHSYADGWDDDGMARLTSAALERVYKVL